MAASVLGPSAVALRFAGTFAFVWVTAVDGYFVSFLLPEMFDTSEIPNLVVLILLGCTHLYLLYRSYYVLRSSGIFIFTTIYLLVAYYVGSMFGTEASTSGLSWLLIFYLTLLYGYGLSFNFIDAALSGLLHTKGV
ncbi:hypothetical protein [Aestuariivirga sp.]|jgi:hypothetical protein|uniref:hypothetical protein n=1 Tax=Aestuariivirga sp. TaxID=2650926 RepID=UPI003784C0FC